MVSGKVESGFILRGHYNAVGTNVNLAVYDSELDFVKTRCSDVKVTDLEETTTQPSEPVLKEEINPKEVNADELPQQTNGANKGKHKARERVAE